MDSELFTPRILRIPYAIASKYARQDTDLFDDLVSIGNEALVCAAARADPALCGEKIACYLYECVKWSVSAHVKPASRSKYAGAKEDFRRGTLSLDVAAIEGGDPLGAGVADHEAPDPTARLEQEELLKVALRHLSPLNRAVYVMRHQKGYTQREVADAMGCCLKTMAARLKGIETFMRRSVAALGRKRGKGTLKAVAPPRSEAQRVAAATFCRDRARADRLLGLIPSATNVFYLAHEGVKTLRGPQKALRPLLASLGVLYRGGKRRAFAMANEDLASLGWRLVRGPEARRLAQYEAYRLLEGES